ncbi:MAG: hypothetical protein ACTSUD_10630, partial [Alphaproteobacteria bacterium]
IVDLENEFGFWSEDQKLRLNGAYDVAIIFNGRDLGVLLDVALENPKHRAVVADRLAKALKRATGDNS